MTAKSKRIIAREFLLTVFCIASGIIAFGGTFLYNMARDYSSRSVLEEAARKRQLADSLESPYLKKIEARAHFYDSSPVKSYYSTHGELWNRLLHLSASDSIAHKWDYVWRQELKIWVTGSGLNGPSDLKKFIEDNRITDQDAADYNRSVKLRKEVKLLSRKDATIIASKMTLDAQAHFSLLSMLVILFVLFPVRFFAMGIVWSVKTLRHG